MLVSFGRRRGLLLLILTFPLLSFRAADVTARGAASPWVCIDVVQVERNVDFYAFIVEADRRIVPAGIDSVWLVVNGNPQAIWMIKADNYTRATHIRYGETPRGFNRRIPASGPAPDLIPGASYRVAIAALGYGTASFVYMQPPSKLSCEAEAALR